MCGDSNTDTKEIQTIGEREKMFRVMCHMSNVTRHLSPTPTAAETPPAESPTINSRLVHQDRTQNTPKILGPKKVMPLIKALFPLPLHSWPLQAGYAIGL